MMDNQGAIIETRTASLETMAVTIQALHVNGKQMTLAVFRQLPHRPLIGGDGQFLGVPWGRVNYLAEDCYAHVVAQNDDLLFRSRVTTKPDDQDYKDWKAETQSGKAKDAILLMAANEANETGGVPETVAAGGIIYNVAWATWERHRVEPRLYRAVGSPPVYKASGTTWAEEDGHPMEWLAAHGPAVIDYERRKQAFMAAYKERLAELDRLPQLFIAV